MVSTLSCTLLGMGPGALVQEYINQVGLCTLALPGVGIGVAASNCGKIGGIRTPQIGFAGQAFPRARPYPMSDERLMLLATR